MDPQPINSMPPPPTGNPLLDNPALKAQIVASMQAKASPAMQSAVMPPVNAGAAPPPPIAMPAGNTPTAPQTAAPHITAPRGTVEGDQSERSRLLSSGSGISQIAKRIEGSGFGTAHPILGKVLGIGAQGLATLGDIGLNATGLGRTLEPLIPGTLGHHEALVRGATSQVGQDVADQEKQAQTTNLQSMPELHEAQLQNAQNKQAENEQHHKAQIDEQLRQHGFKSDEQGNVVPLEYGEMSEQQQAVHDLKASQEELADATASLRKEQANPNSAQAQLAQQRIQGANQARAIAMQRLGLSEKQFEMRAHGTEGGVPLAGSMQTDSGQSVGTAFQQNVRPTGQERNKADMANSASEQLNDIKSIVARHPTLFGPGYGQSSAFRQWIGSQDPDAQRFIAARTIAGDHLAGTFGGRSEAALKALDTAIGQFKDNPQAMQAGIDQLLKANTRFQKAGAVRTAGSNAAGQGESPASSGKAVSLKDAMALPQFKGQSEDQVRKAIEAHGHQVIP